MRLPEHLEILEIIGYGPFVVCIRNKTNGETTKITIEPEATVAGFMEALDRELRRQLNESLKR